MSDADRLPGTEIVDLASPSDLIDVLARVRQAREHHQALIIAATQPDQLAQLVRPGIEVIPAVCTDGQLDREATEERLARLRQSTRSAESVRCDDLTFMLPVRIDHPDRLRNLVSVVTSLRETTTARVLVGVADPSALDGLVPDGVDVVALVDPPTEPFHHTRMTNQLTSWVETALVANHDADVIVPLGQLRAALELLRSGGAGAVHPYGDLMIDVPWTSAAWLRRAQYEAIPTTDQRHHPFRVIGGCVIWRRTEYLRIGMANERFASWGLEDDEVVSRAARLGVSVARLDGPIYHLRHWRAADSGPDHPRYAENRAELARIESMPPERLADEVGNWPWVVKARDSAHCLRS